MRTNTTTEDSSTKQPTSSVRGFSGQFFVAGELSRRGLVAVITNGNCPHTDILVSNVQATAFVHIQVKTFRPGDKTCSVGMKAEHDYGNRFFWVLAGIPSPRSNIPFTYYIIPAAEMAIGVSEEFSLWATTPGRYGQQRKQDNPFRAVYLPPSVGGTEWDLSVYLGRWDLITEAVDKAC